jgi:hypothetical protein
MMRKSLRRFWAVVVLLATIGLPSISGCTAAEEPKTPEQIEKSRLEHQETSRREMGQ